VNFLTGAKLQLFNNNNEHPNYLEPFKPFIPGTPDPLNFPTFAEMLIE
jgi:hypothetical protein